MPLGQEAQHAAGQPFALERVRAERQVWPMHFERRAGHQHDAVPAVDLVELALDSDFQYECWMLTTSARWRSPIVKAIDNKGK